MGAGHKLSPSYLPHLNTSNPAGRGAYSGACLLTNFIFSFIPRLGSLHSLYKAWAALLLGRQSMGWVNGWQCMAGMALHLAWW